MKTVIAGSRTITDINYLISAIEEIDWEITEVVSGNARGADHLGELWAEFMQIPVKNFPANWNKFGKSAGYKRNAEMADYADAVIVLWDGESRGTKQMISLAESKNLKLIVKICT
jgi:hypothetical protein